MLGNSPYFPVTTPCKLLKFIVCSFKERCKVEKGREGWRHGGSAKSGMGRLRGRVRNPTLRGAGLLKMFFPHRTQTCIFWDLKKALQIRAPHCSRMRGKGRKCGGYGLGSGAPSTEGTNPKRN